LMGPGTAVIDPAPSIARQVAHVLTQREPKAACPIDSKPGEHYDSHHTFFTSGDVAAFTRMIKQLLSPSLEDRPDVRPVTWQTDRLELQQ
jgi:hypothetical protein